MPRIENNEFHKREIPDNIKLSSNFAYSFPKNILTKYYPDNKENINYVSLYKG